MNKTGQYIAGQKNLLSIYFTAEYPIAGSTKEIILALQDAGADLIEIGIPFSDPLADGAVIQHSSQEALQNGFSLHSLFDDLESLHGQVHIPLVLMGYFNTMLSFGIEIFLKKCIALGIDTLIIPDLPPDIYQSTYSLLFEEAGISPVFLITPQTTPERIEYIHSLSNAFIYAVSQNRITGGTADISDAQLQYFSAIKKMQLDVPVLIGFGITDHQSYTQACQHAQGAIIGSAFIKAIGNQSNLTQTIHSFIHDIKTGK